jgi:hypothetical protein
VSTTIMLELLAMVFPTVAVSWLSSHMIAGLVTNEGRYMSLWQD